MKLEEAINHCEEVLERDDMCEECKQEHKQLAKWLKELKLLRDMIVKCSDCVSREECSKQIHLNLGGYVDIHFCSYGERRTDNDL